MKVFEKAVGIATGSPIKKYEPAATNRAAIFDSAISRGASTLNVAVKAGVKRGADILDILTLRAINL
jgi:hypothetical protein